MLQGYPQWARATFGMSWSRRHHAFTLVMKYGEMYLVGDFCAIHEKWTWNNGTWNWCFPFEESEIKRAHFQVSSKKLPGCTYHSYNGTCRFWSNIKKHLEAQKTAPHCSRKKRQKIPKKGKKKNGEIPRFFISNHFFFPKFDLWTQNSARWSLSWKLNWHHYRAYPNLRGAQVRLLVSSLPRVWQM